MATTIRTGTSVQIRAMIAYGLIALLVVGVSMIIIVVRKKNRKKRGGYR